MFNLFPFTNFHDLNMDWIIKSIKTLWNKSVFTVNNTEPDANGNVNLPTVAGVSSVNRVGADGNGNVALKTQMPLLYKVFSNPTANFEEAQSCGVLTRSGIAELKIEGTIKADTVSGAVLETLPDDIPLPSGYVRIFGWDDNGNIHVVSVDNNTNQVKTLKAYNEDTRVHIFGCYLLVGNVFGGIIAQ